MRALTVRQPCASCIARGLKPVENRSRPVPGTLELPELIAIHAGLAEHPGCRDKLTARDLIDLGDLPRGAIAATAVLARYHHADECEDPDDWTLPDSDGESHRRRSWCSRWAQPDMWHWELEDPQPVADPIPMRGRLGLWHLPDDLAHHLTKERTP